MCKYLEKKLYANIFCSSVDNLKCTPSDRQMYPWGYMYPRLGTPVLDDKLSWYRHITNLEDKLARNFFYEALEFFT